MTTPVAQPTARLLAGLLPEHLWARDARAGGALAALIAALAEDYDRLGADVDRLYDDLFVATCRPRFLPYIGAGIGIEGLAPVHGPGVSDRALVGRAIALRRRKGTLATIGAAVTATTGWPAVAQDGRGVTAHAQSVAFPQPTVGRLVDVGALPAGGTAAALRGATRTAGVGGRALRPGAGTADVEEQDGAFPLPATVSIALWRLVAFPVTQREPAPAAVEGHRGRAFHVHPLGIDAPLFNPGARASDPERPAALDDMPRPLSVAALGGGDAATAGDPPVRIWTAVAAGAPLTAIPSARVAAGDLRDWAAAARAAADLDAIVDPVRGRLLLTTAAPPAAVRVDASYGAVGEIGGGPFAAAGDARGRARATTIVGIAGDDGALDRALAAAPDLPAGEPALLLIEDSARHRPPPGGWTLALPAGAQLRLASATNATPTLAGDLHVALAAGSRLDLSGLLLGGTLTVEGAGTLVLEQCTIGPRSTDALVLRADPGARLAVSARFCVLGAVRAGARVALGLADTLAGHDGQAVGSRHAPLPELTLARVTALGAVHAQALIAEDCLFADAVHGDRGLVRASHLAAGSRPPATLGCTDGADGLRPLFTSTRYGDPGFGQLDLRCPAAIATGGQLGSEPGALSWLGQPARRARLPTTLHDQLPFGMAASIDFRT